MIVFNSECACVLFGLNYYNYIQYIVSVSNIDLGSAKILPSYVEISGAFTAGVLRCYMHSTVTIDGCSEIVVGASIRARYRIVRS